MRKAPTDRARRFFAPLIATLMVALSLVTVTGSAASATDTCDKLGYTKIDQAAGTNVAVPFGTLTWNGNAGGAPAKTTLTYTITAGYTVSFCIKAGVPTYESGPITGPASSTFTAGGNNGISHIGYSFTYDECPNMPGNQPQGTTCTTPQSVTPNPQAQPSTCVNGVYGAPTLTNVATPNTTHVITGDGNSNGVWDENEGRTVTYTANSGYTLTQSVFPFSFLAAWVTDDECSPPTTECPNGDMNGPNFPGCDRPEQPNPEERRVNGMDDGCDIGGVRTWVDVYTTPYVWSDTDGWVLGTETGPVRVDDVFTPYTPDELAELCRPDQPAPETRTETGEREGCRLGGVLSWTDTWTTTYAWDEDAQEWVGTETGPVRTEEFDEYSDAEFTAKCTDVLGEQDEDDDGKPAPDVEVAGEQAGVPSAVDAGQGDALVPLGSQRNPLWLMAVGGGLGLIGVAGRRRRPAARR